MEEHIGYTIADVIVCRDKPVCLSLHRIHQDYGAVNVNVNVAE